MSIIGVNVKHSRYGICEITHIWSKLINPVDKTVKLEGVTFKILSTKGKELFNKDRRTLFLNDPLPRCYERDLSKITKLK